MPILLAFILGLGTGLWMPELIAAKPAVVKKFNELTATPSPATKK